MFRFVRSLFAAPLLLILMACAPSPIVPTLPPAAPSPTPSRSPTVALAPAVARAPQTVALDFDAARALQYNQMIGVTIGSRPAGSDIGVKAGDYIAQQYADAGFTVEKQAFPFQAWEDHGTQVQVTAPEARSINATPIQYSPAGTVQADMVAVQGNGTESDFANAKAQGKIALVSRGTIPFSDKANNAAKAGALAILIYNNDPGSFTGGLRDPVTIPTLAISGQDGKTLLGLLSQGAVQVKVDSKTEVAQKTGHNIIGTLKGTTDDVIVLGGHYDSVSAGPGANDNGSGTAVLLELARDLGHQNHKYTLVMISFDGEELGLLGSRYYADHLSASDRSKIKGMLNFDMLGGGSGPLLLGGDGNLGQMGRDIAGQLNITARNFHLGGGAGSDHESFQRIGVDTIFFSRDYSLLHTPQDTIDQVKQEYLDEAGRVAIRMVAQLDAE